MRTLSQTFSQTCLIIRVQPDAAGERGRDQLLRAAVHHAGCHPAAEGKSRLRALVRADRGFIGVLIVTNPGAETFQIGALFALANAMIYGSSPPRCAA